ncbi:NUDIX hydrolase [Saccharopolyspora sp. NPDC002578]
MSTTTHASTPRLGARVLLLDSDDRVLLIHARDPDAPEHQWWELPGGGIDPGETAHDTARREITEETGLVLDDIGPLVWTRESRFTYRGQQHHRQDEVFLARLTDTHPTRAPKHSANETAGLLGQHWWTTAELAETTSELLPPELPRLMESFLDGTLTIPVHLND